MARVIVSPKARRNLTRLIETHSLPDTTFDRFEASLQHLQSFPLIGPALSGRWFGYRYILGPWDWMLIVYEYHDDQDLVGVVTVQDARAARSPTSRR
jgi:plasmid stabilization system protein ParE